MSGRTQKISKNETCPQKKGTTSEGYVTGQTFLWITENNLTDTDQLGDGMLEFILSPSNLNRAYQQVKRNKGSGGVDKMEVEPLKDYPVEHKDELIASILKGTYRPNPVRRVLVPKDNGQKRQLGIPTVVDRCIQQAIAQVLMPMYEPQFSDHSYGFRPRRNAHGTLRKCQAYITDGYKDAVDLDLEKFFDTVNHSKLIEILSRTVKDGRAVSLIHKYLNAGVQVGSKTRTSEEGVPQGGPLSPILSNIMLNEMDKELESREHKFVRFADDLLILCRSKRSAERTMSSMIHFIEDKLFLKVNREKSQTAHIGKVKFLGYSFYKSKGEGRLRIHPKSVTKMKAKIKELTFRSNGWGNARMKEALRQYITGWVNYFKLADIKKLLLRIDQWYRRRIRMVIWKHWKRVRTRVKNPIKLGVRKSKAWEWANTRKSYWHTANSFILKTTITTENLRKAGYVMLSNQYRKG
ncbi:group II intron reverse transcriptase/maturase [Gelidibacter salicanalis]|uniref:RNA-directed DNA polymerase n=1 Tax=Gelidibacter salicanalis TaxID=291193 RepID=A0A934KUJ1_9FLAO|nr:group II intron reverse transcriptase/maturase [Gelidibacter salicanalis]MBJ7880463.1 group II intron reverse transcriptase/maturase [Gelidibacter salicanalis]